MAGTPATLTCCAKRSTGESAKTRPRDGVRRSAALTSQPDPPEGTESASVHAELVALWVTHHVGERSAIVVSRNELRTEGREPGDLISLAVGFDVDVEMHSVLRDLALRNPLKEAPGLHAVRIPAGRHVSERRAPVDDDAILDRHAAVRDEPVDEVG